MAFTEGDTMRGRQNNTLSIRKVTTHRLSHSKKAQEARSGRRYFSQDEVDTFVIHAAGRLCIFEGEGAGLS